MYDFDFALAEREFLRALELNPGFIQARAWYALFYGSMIRGRVDEAVEHTTDMVARDPLSGYAWGVHAFTRSRALGQAGTARRSTRRSKQSRATRRRSSPTGGSRTPTKPFPAFPKRSPPGTRRSRFRRDTRGHLQFSHPHSAIGPSALTLEPCTTS